MFESVCGLTEMMHVHFVCLACTDRYEIARYDARRSTTQRLKIFTAALNEPSALDVLSSRPITELVIKRVLAGRTFTLTQQASLLLSLLLIYLMFSSSQDYRSGFR